MIALGLSVPPPPAATGIRRMLALARDFGFEIRPHPDDPMLVAAYRDLETGGGV